MVENAIEGPGNAQYIDPRFACGTAPCFMVGGQDAWFLQQVIGKAANAGVLDRLKMTLALSFNRGAAELTVKNDAFRFVVTMFSKTTSSLTPVGVRPEIPAFANKCQVGRSPSQAPGTAACGAQAP